MEIPVLIEPVPSKGFRAAAANRSASRRKGRRARRRCKNCVSWWQERIADGAKSISVEVGPFNIRGCAWPGPGSKTTPY